MTTITTGSKECNMMRIISVQRLILWSTGTKTIAHVDGFQSRSIDNLRWTCGQTSATLLHIIKQQFCLWGNSMDRLDVQCTFSLIGTGSNRLTTLIFNS